ARRHDDARRPHRRGRDGRAPHGRRRSRYLVVRAATRAASGSVPPGDPEGRPCALLMTDATTDSLTDALAAVRAHTDAEPEMVLILGSGLGALADEAEDAVIIPTADIPDSPRSTVPGHAGRLVFGRLEGRTVLFVQGRVHLYEGHPPRALPFPVRLAHALGARKLLVTNAAGGIDPTMGPGTLMFIADHINLA